MFYKWTSTIFPRFSVTIVLYGTHSISDTMMYDEIESELFVKFSLDS